MPGRHSCRMGGTSCITARRGYLITRAFTSRRSMDTRQPEHDTGAGYRFGPGIRGVPNSRNGLLLFLRQGSLVAQGFDGRSQLTDDAIRIAEDVGNTGSYGWFSASATGASRVADRAATRGDR